MFHRKPISKILIEWYTQNVNSQGDNYYARELKDKKWVVGNINDYPLQHGPGDKKILSEAEVNDIIKGIHHD